MSERPLSRGARQALVQQLVEAHMVSSQTDLADLLAERGVSVRQGTISKDLLELRAVRRRDSDGAMRYVIAPPEDDGGEKAHVDKLVKLCQEVLLDAQASANLVIARTPPGAAQYFASAIDKAVLPGILGTIAGDDTVLLVTLDPAGGEAVAEELLTYGSRKS